MPRIRPFLAASSCSFLVATAAACSRNDAPSDADLGDVVAWQRTIELEENDDVINVTPSVSIDPEGGFLVADPREAQLRRYTPEGRLAWHVGRTGSGPGEFRSLAHALRLASGEVLALEWNGRATVFDSDRAEVLRTLTTPFANVEHVARLGDSLLLVSALGGETGVQGPRLYLWDPATNAVRRSFFEPMRTVVNPAAATVVTWTKVAVRGDTIAAVFALADTIHFFTTAGNPIGSLPISSPRFRRVGTHAPGPTNDRGRLARWLSSFDYVSGLHWMPDGRFVIVYQSVRPEASMERVFHLFVMDRSGRALREVREIPQLLASDARTGELYFVAENHETPNRWAVATLRP